MRWRFFNEVPNGVTHHKIAVVYADDKGIPRIKEFTCVQSVYVSDIKKYTPLSGYAVICWCPSDEMASQPRTAKLILDRLIVASSCHILGMEITAPDNVMGHPSFRIKMAADEVAAAKEIFNLK